MLARLSLTHRVRSQFAQHCSLPMRNLEHHLHFLKVCQKTRAPTGIGPKKCHQSKLNKKENSQSNKHQPQRQTRFDKNVLLGKLVLCYSAKVDKDSACTGLF